MEGNEGRNLTSSIHTEYEEVIYSMQAHIESTKEEHKKLKDELLHLISENQNLANKLDLEYKERLKESMDGDFSEGFKSEIIINLQSQLDLCKKEKEKILELYKTSLKLIEKLEGESSTHHDEKCHVQVSKSAPVVSVLEAKLKNAKEHLEITLNGKEQLESENIKHQTEIAKLRLNLDSKNNIIDQFKAKDAESKTRFTKLEQDYTLLNATFECVVQSRNELEKKLETYEMKIQELVGKNNESRSKVEEALDVVEKALAEKNSTVMREVRLKEEITKLHMCLEHVIEEAGKKVGAEVEETKKKFASNIKELAEELNAAKSELEKKKVEHKRLSFKYKKLEKLASAKLDKEKISLIKGSETEIVVLENHLDSVYQELERLKLKYEEMGKEKKALEDEFSELIEKHETLAKEKNSREAYWEEAVSELKSQIDHKVEDLSESSRRAEFFLNQVRDLQAENKDLRKTIAACTCSKLRGKLKKLNEIREKQKTELEAHVESQMKLNETWRREIKEMTEKFEERIREVKKECNEAKAQNRKLVSELNKMKKRNFSLV